MNPKFHNKNGTLTAYALACGYIERKGEWQLFRDGCFHVRKNYTEWFTFATLTEARKEFAKLTKGGN